MHSKRASRKGCFTPVPNIPLSVTSGKEKAHKHKQISPVIARVGGGSPDRVARGLPTGGQGSKVYVLCAEPKEHKHFRPGTRPAGSVTGVTEKLFMCQMFMCLFRPLSPQALKTDKKSANCPAIQCWTMTEINSKRINSVSHDRFLDGTWGKDRDHRLPG